MRILILNSDYPQFLRWLYASRPELTATSYAGQMQARNDSLFGGADYYSRNFAALGHQAADIHINNAWMQNAWAHENGLKVAIATNEPRESHVEGLTLRLKRALRPFRAVFAPLAQRLGLLGYTLGEAQAAILEAQVEAFRPDVIINQEMHAISAAIIARLKKRGRILVGQCGIHPPPASELRPYDFAVSILPWVIDDFRAKGLPAELNHLAFEPTILDRLRPPPEKDVAVSFIGSIGSDHGARLAFLEAIAKRHSLALWMPSRKGLPPGSPLYACYRGEAWGAAMYNVLRQSKITLNMHIGAARGIAANMRLYEATGVGTFLLTDNLKKLPELFEPGVHLVAYDSAEHCVELIDHYLKAEDEREIIAKAGQQHTLAHHTYRQHVAQLLEFIAKYAR